MGSDCCAQSHVRPTSARHFERGGGFTLIEVLVVVAIIALLISILLPSLRKARLLAQEVACKAQMQQLGVAVHTYTAANRCLPGTSDVWWSSWENAGSPANAAGKNLPFWRPSDTWLGLLPPPTYPWGTVLQQQEIWDHIAATVPQRGSLWRYARDRKVFLCAADKKGLPDPENPAGGGGNGVFSYTLNGLMGFVQPERLQSFTYVKDFEVKEAAVPAREEWIRAGTRVVWSPSEMMLLYEEHPWNNTNHGIVNDSLSADSYLALRHDPKGRAGRANFGYVDGHVASKRYNYWGDFVNRAGVRDAKLQGLDIWNEYRLPYSYDGNAGGEANVRALVHQFKYPYKGAIGL